MVAKISVLAVLCLSIWVTAYDFAFDVEKKFFVRVTEICAREMGHSINNKNAFTDLCKNGISQYFAFCLLDELKALDEKGDIIEDFFNARYEGEGLEDAVRRCVEEGRDKEQLFACTTLNCFRREGINIDQRN